MPLAYFKTEIGKKEICIRKIKIWDWKNKTME